MSSNLKLLVSENPDVDFFTNHISEPEKNQIIVWYNNVISTVSDFSAVSETFLWCCQDGAQAESMQNSDSFINALEQKAQSMGISRESLATLYFSHSALFNDASSGEISSSKKPDDPLFIVFEGLDGSGKSTQISMLKDKLKLMGKKVHVTAEPTTSATGGLIRDALSNNYKREPSELASLFLTDRVTHNVNPVWGIQKILNNGISVLCDRYYYSSFAYQGLGTDLQWVMDINLNCPQILKPDLCIYLDVDPGSCKSRIDSERAHREIFEEDEKFMRDTRSLFFDVFNRLGPDENIKIINANRPINEVASDIMTTVMSLRQHII